MIELTEQQLRALEDTESTPPRIANPRTKEVYALIPTDQYELMRQDEYDDRPWTREELEALAWETHQRRGGEVWGEYDDDQQ